MNLEVGQMIDGKYRIGRIVGEGGMGAVYEAEHLRIGRRVAIKVLHGYVGKNREHVERFQQEAQASARIGSPHIVDVLDLGEIPDIGLFLVMEFLEGQTLDERLTERGSLPAEIVVPIALELLEGLGRAHAAGIVHRDMKPENVFLLPNGPYDFVKIVDFGVSKFTLNAHPNRTRTGSVMGTPHYMAPEQASGQTQRVDLRTDLYAVGVILYRCVTGQLPFDGENVNEVLFKVALERPKAAADVAPHVDQRFSELISKAMAHDPADRFQNAQDFSLALEEWFESVNKRETIPAPVPRPASSPGIRSPYQYRRPSRPSSTPRLTPSAAASSGYAVSSSVSARETTHAPWEAGPTKMSLSSTPSLFDALALGRKRRRRLAVGATLLTVAIVGGVWWQWNGAKKPSSAPATVVTTTAATGPTTADPAMAGFPVGSGAPAKAESLPSSLPVPVVPVVPAPLRGNGAAKKKSTALDSPSKSATAPAPPPAVPPPTADPTTLAPAGRKFRTNL